MNHQFQIAKLSMLALISPLQTMEAVFMSVTHVIPGGLSE